MRHYTLSDEDLQHIGARRRPRNKLGFALQLCALRYPGLRRELEHLLDETVDVGVTRFVWLRRFEPGSNSAAANRLLDRLEHLRHLDFPEGLFDDVPAHRITRLRRHGERYFADGLHELPENPSLREFSRSTSGVADRAGGGSGGC